MLRRRWVVAPVPRRDVLPPDGVELRSTTPDDDVALAALLDEAYLGTIDYDAGHSHAEELAEWRGTDHGDDDASTAATAGGSSVGACLMGVDLGATFVSELVVAPSHKGQGLSAVLLARSLGRLGTDVDAAWAWITVGNTPSERAFTTAGFVPVTMPIDQPRAILRYRGAAARLVAEVTGETASTVLVSDTGVVRLVVVAEVLRPPVTVDVRGQSVDVTWITPDDPTVALVAQDGMPVTGIAWLLTHRPT